MSQQLINHNPDLKRLRDEGYEIEIRGGYLLIHHIPYVDQNKQIQVGVLVSTLDNIQDHVIFFTGENPCEIDGTVITAIQHINNSSVLNNTITVNRSFSNKPNGGYQNYYEKIKRYADLISAPAKYLDPSVTEKTFKVIPDSGNETELQLLDWVVRERIFWIW